METKWKKQKKLCFKIIQGDTGGSSLTSDVSECAFQQAETVIQPAGRKKSPLGPGKRTSHIAQRGWSPSSLSFSCVCSFPCQPPPGPRWHTASPPGKTGRLKGQNKTPLAFWRCLPESASRPITHLMITLSESNSSSIAYFVSDLLLHAS